MLWWRQKSCWNDDVSFTSYCMTSKLILISGIRYAYESQASVEVRVARIFNTFGPRMHPNDGRVVSNFIIQVTHCHTVAASDWIEPGLARKRHNDIWFGKADSLLSICRWSCRRVDSTHEWKLFAACQPWKPRRIHCASEWKIPVWRLMVQMVLISSPGVCQFDQRNYSIKFNNPESARYKRWSSPAPSRHHNSKGTIELGTKSTSLCHGCKAPHYLLTLRFLCAKALPKP